PSPQVVRGDVAAPPGADQAVLEQRGERRERLLDGRLRIGLVRQVEVDPIDTEPREARLDLPQHALTGEPEVGPVLHRVEGLRRDPRAVAARLEPLADPGLAAPAAVGVGVVEPAEPERPAGVHDVERLLAGLALAEEGWG